MKLSMTMQAQPYGRWAHVAVAVDREVANAGYVYVDGVIDVTEPATLTGAITSKRFCLGGLNGFGGMLDEVRVYGTAKPAAWFAAEVDNVTNPTFVTIGDEPRM